MTNETDRYVSEVMRHIHAPAEQRGRMEADLRAHLQAAVEGGEAPRAAIARMGTPLEVAAEFMSQVTLRYAGFWPRLAACAVDLAAMVALAGFLALLALACFANVPKQPQGLDWLAGGLLLAIGLALVLACVGAIIAYFPIFEGRFGWTPGKRLMRLHVLREDGLPIGYKEALLRRLPFYLEIMPFDAIFIPFTARRQRAFDIVARTIVVQD